MNARSLISPAFSSISSPRVRFPSKRALFNLAQLSMVMGYFVLMLRPFDGDAMMLGLLCEAAALWLYVMSRSDVTTKNGSEKNRSESAADAEAAHARADDR